MYAQPEPIYEFGSFRLDPSRRLLFRGREMVPLPPKAFDLLLTLVRNRGRVLAKSELIETLWPESFVEEANLYVYVSALRKALGESPGDHRYIVTVPRRGFNFVAEVCECEQVESGEEIAPSSIAEKSLDRMQVLNFISSQLKLSRAIPFALLLLLIGAALSVWLIANDLKESEQPGRSYRTNSEAYRAYIKGRYFWNMRTEEGFEKAIEYFDQAIELAPDYGPAYAGLADSYALLSVYAVRPAQDAYPKAQEAAMKALALDDTLAEAHAALANAHLRSEWDWLRAGREFTRAIELNPNYATARHWYGEYLMMMGKFDAALAEIKYAQELDPLSAIITSDYGWAFYYARDYERAIEQAKQALELDPDFKRARHLLALAYAQKGMYRESLAELEKAGHLAAPDMAGIYARSGEKEKALYILERYKQFAEKGSPLSFVVASIYAGLGEKEQAFVWLEKAYRSREPWMIYLKNDPRFDDLRGDLRFDLLLRRIGFELEHRG